MNYISEQYLDEFVGAIIAGTVILGFGALLTAIGIDVRNYKKSKEYVKSNIMPSLLPKIKKDIDNISLQIFPFGKKLYSFITQGAIRDKDFKHLYFDLNEKYNFRNLLNKNLYPLAITSYISDFLAIANQKRKKSPEQYVDINKGQFFTVFPLSLNIEHNKDTYQYYDMAHKYPGNPSYLKYADKMYNEVYGMENTIFHYGEIVHMKFLRNLQLQIIPLYQEIVQ